MLQSLGADSLSVIENPAAIGPTVYEGTLEVPAGVGAAQGPPAWVGGAGSPNQGKPSAIHSQCMDIYSFTTEKGTVQY